MHSNNYKKLTTINTKYGNVFKVDIYYLRALTAIGTEHSAWMPILFFNHLTLKANG
jgi:hypothetical protein